MMTCNPSLPTIYPGGACCKDGNRAINMSDAKNKIKTGLLLARSRAKV